MVCPELSLSCCVAIGVPRDLRWVSRETLELRKGSQANCHLRCGTRDGTGANPGESGFILS